MPTAHADRARLAHRALRLRESGLDSEAKLNKAAAEARKHAASAVHPNAAAIVTALRRGDHDTAAELAKAHVVTPAVTLPALGGIAQAVLNAKDPEADGITDTKLVTELMTMESLTDIWKVWDEATTANLETTAPDDQLKAWRAATVRSQKRFEERVAEMQETGEFNVHPYFGHMRHADGAANALYDSGRQAYLGGDTSWDGGDMRVILVDSADYTVNLATHDFLDDIIAGARVAVSPSLANKTITAGVADSDDTSFTAVTGDPSEALVIYDHTGGADTARRLIGYIDTATGLPVTPNGGNINVAWDSGSNRIFKL